MHQRGDFMETAALREGDEFIKLGQLLKKAGMVGSGADAKFVIEEGQVFYNGEVETRRGKKVYPGDKVSYNGQEVMVVPFDGES